MHISVVSIGKSVASTSLAVGLASVLHDRRNGSVLIELDPSGGDLAAMWGVSGVIGTTNLIGAIAVEELLSPSILEDVALASPFGFPVVVSHPAGGTVADKVCADLGGRYGRVLAAGTSSVVCDAGRWRSGEPAASRVSGASVIVALFTPDPGGVTRVVSELGQLRLAAPRVPILLVVVGENPYPAHEIEAALGGGRVLVLASQRDVVRAFVTGNGTSRQVNKLKKSLWWRSLMRLLVDIERATGIELPKTKLNERPAERPRRRRLGHIKTTSMEQTATEVAVKLSEQVPEVSPLLGNRSEPAVTNG